MRASRLSGIFLSHAKADGEAPGSDRIPQSVLHYEIQTKLGQGGMGVVYKAIDKKLNRAVALKFLPLQIDRSNTDLQRFLQEAQALSALNHPHIATIYAVEDGGEQQFIVLEYLAGGTLKAKLQEAYGSGGSLAIDDIVKYARQTAEGLAHAHSRGIVHRDVKTSNLMLTAEGNVKITDFGVAKLGGSPLATIPGSLMGTIAYMSPEQALGMEVDARSDVFSFGVCLFEMITGRLPFEAPNDAALITKVASARAPELKEYRGDVPAGLELVLQGAMKKRVEDRYQTMDDVLQDLQGPVPAGLPITQTRIRSTLRPSVRSTPKRARWIAAVSVVSLVALLGGVLFVNWPQRTKQLVVLRLRNVSGDPSNQALCDGLTELLTNKLSQVAQLQGQVDKLRGPLSVVPASEVLKEAKEGKQEVTSAQAARSVHGAALVVEGSVQRMDGRVIVTFSLVDTDKQTILDARDVAVPSEQLSGLQDLLVSKASEMLKVHLKPEARRALAAELPKSASAYELYLQGRGYLQRYDRVDNLDSAIEVFQRALTQDSAYALAYAGLAEAYLRKYKATKAPELISQARNSANRAVELNATLAPVHYAMGLIHAAGGDYDFAIERFKSSIKIQAEPDAYRELANAYDSSNRPKEAEATYRSAIQMRPTYWAGYRDLAVFHQDHGRFEEALPLFMKVVELTPDNYRGWANLGGLYLRLPGMHAKAIEYFEKANAITPTYIAYYNLGTAFYQLKRYDDAIEMYKKATQLTQTDARPWGMLGDLYRDWTQSQDAMRDAYAHAIQLTKQELLVNPNEGQNWARIASWRVATDQKTALEEIREALSLAPDDGFVWARAASVYEQSSLRDEAVAAAKAALEHGFSRVELESWRPLVRLLQDPRYQGFIEERARKSSPVQRSTSK